MNRDSFDDILQYDYIAITQGNSYENSFDNCLAYGNTKLSISNFSELEIELQNTEERIFGYFSYDLKNELEDLKSNNSDKLNFAPLFFFKPEKQKELTVSEISPKPIETKVAFNCDWTKEDYIKTVKVLQNHILEGDIYEINFCMEFHAKSIDLQKASVQKLN